MVPRLSRIALPLLLGASAATQSPAQGRTGRIVGVYDDATGQPVAEAEVVDLLTGWTARTTATGTLSLFYVDTGGTLLRIRKLGYIPQTFPVKNGAADTVPLTIVLKPSAQMLPAAVTKTTSSRGPADTVRKLDLSGFYERRNSQGAPLSAFITQEQLRKVTLVSEVARYAGRPLCQSNVYIDGVRVEMPNLNMSGRRTTKLLKDGIDALLEPSMIVAIEVYKVGDTPAEYNPTLPAGKAPCGATLIWTK